MNFSLPGILTRPPRWLGVACLAGLLVMAAQGGLAQKSLAPERAAEIDRRRAEIATLREVLDSDATDHTKRQAIDTFRALRKEESARLEVSTGAQREELAATRARTAEWVAALPAGPRKELLLERLAFAEKLRELSDQSTGLSDAERSARSRELIEAHRAATAPRMAALEAERKSRSTTREGTDPIHRALDAERAKLHAKLEQTSDPDARRTAIQDFRAAMQRQLRAPPATPERGASSQP